MLSYSRLSGYQKNGCTGSVFVMPVYNLIQLGIPPTEHG